MLEQVIQMMNELYEKQRELMKTHQLCIVKGVGFMWVKKDELKNPLKVCRSKDNDAGNGT